MEKIIKILLISLFTIIVLNSCNKITENRYKYSISSDTFCLDKKLSTSFLDFTTINQINDTIWLCLKPALSGYIYTYAYEPNNITFIRKDSIIQKPGDSLCGTISNAALINKDSIILFQKKKISIYNFQKKEIVYEYYHSSYDTSKVVLLDRNQPIIWNKERKSFLILIIRLDNSKTRKNNSDAECVGEFNISNKKLTYLGIKYSSDYNSDKINLPFLDPFFACNEKVILTAYGISPDINIYNFKTRKSNFVTLKHKHYSEIRGISRDSARFKDNLINTIVHTFRYVSIIYDPYKKLFYRFYELSMNTERNEDGFIKTYKEKKLGVNIIDENINVIDDIILDSVHLPRKWFPTTEGLFQITSTKEKLVLSKLKIEKK